MDREKVDAAEDGIRDEIGVPDCEIRESLSITQVELAERFEHAARMAAAIEHSDVVESQLDTLRRYVEAVGGTLRVEVVIGDDQILIA